MELKIELNDPSRSHDGRAIYITNGSKTDRWVGYAISTGEESITMRISEKAAIYTAVSIEHLGANRMGNGIVICTDSKSSVLAVYGLYPKHPIVSDIQGYCNHGNAIRMCWVPSHVGVQMKERVDQAAKSAIENKVTDIPRTDLKNQVKAIITSRFDDR